ncbi:MAG TPA: hypothetical protein VMB05_01950 [Solirubrobacteraceae bacterium]|nr:hypothetical protein [Solirubrobacteraceae bacterium]
MSLSPTLTVPASLVSMMRIELLREVAGTADLLSRLTFPGQLQEEYHYNRATQRLSAARGVLTNIGVVAPLVERPVELCVDEDALIAYEVLKHRHARMLQEVEDAEQEGRTVAAIDPALGEFLEALHREIDSQDSMIVGLGVRLLDG